jgi:hypothetical protein
MTNEITSIATLLTVVTICFVGASIIYWAVVEAFKLLGRWLTRRFGLCLLDWIQEE